MVHGAGCYGTLKRAGPKKYCALGKLYSTKAEIRASVEDGVSRQHVCCGIRSLDALQTNRNKEMLHALFKSFHLKP